MEHLLDMQRIMLPFRFLGIKSENDLVEVNFIIKIKKADFFEENKWPTSSKKS